jgi:hypothetical protein
VLQVFNIHGKRAENSTFWFITAGKTVFGVGWIGVSIRLKFIVAGTVMRKIKEYCAGKRTSTVMPLNSTCENSQPSTTQDSKSIK